MQWDGVHITPADDQGLVQTEEHVLSILDEQLLETTDEFNERILNVDAKYATMFSELPSGSSDQDSTRTLAFIAVLLGGINLGILLGVMVMRVFFTQSFARAFGFSQVPTNKQTSQSNQIDIEM